MKTTKLRATKDAMLKATKITKSAKRYPQSSVASALFVSFVSFVACALADARRLQTPLLNGLWHE